MATIVAGLTALGVVVLPGSAQAAPSEPKTVYLTFDDGPDGLNDLALLRILRREQVKATFFLIGRSLAADPEAAKRLWLQGHAVGNHTYSHVDLTTVPAATVTHELATTQHLLGAVGGACVRPPYGAVTSGVIGVAAAMGMKPVLWSVDPEDWAHQDTGYIVAHVLTHVTNRSVVLLHDGGGDRTATVRAVKQLIPALRARGYQFKTVAACRVPLKVTASGLGKIDRPAPVVSPSVTPTPTVPDTPTATP